MNFLDISRPELESAVNVHLLIIVSAGQQWDDVGLVSVGCQQLNDLSKRLGARHINPPYLFIWRHSGSASVSAGSLKT